MQLIDEQDDLALGLFHLGKDGLQPFLKFAAVFCTRNQRAHIQRENGLILKRLRDFIGDDALRQSFDDGRLADARFADENGVVLRLAGQDADHVSDLVVTADDRVHLLLSRALDKVGAVFFKGLVGVLRRVVCHALIAADGLQSLQNGFFFDVIGAEQVFQRIVRAVDQGKQQMLDGDEVVLHALGKLFRLRQCLIDLARDIEAVGLPAGAGHARELVDLRRDGGIQALDGNAHLFQKLRHKAAVLLQQRREQMHLLDLLVLILNGQLLGRLNGLQRFLRIILCVHTRQLLALALSTFEC